MKNMLIPLFLASLLGHLPAQARDGAAPAPLLCDASDAAYAEENVEAVEREFGKHATKIFGKNWERIKADVRQKAKADPQTMAEVAKIAGCVAIMDKESGCGQFFSPDLSMTLNVFTDMSPKVPLRRQFDAAIKALPEGPGKKAALYCMKAVARK
jgi:hypothetical protein